LHVCCKAHPPPFSWNSSTFEFHESCTSGFIIAMLIVCPAALYVITMKKLPPLEAASMADHEEIAAHQRKSTGAITKKMSFVYRPTQCIATMKLPVKLVQVCLWQHESSRLLHAINVSSPICFKFTSACLFSTSANNYHPRFLMAIRKTVVIFIKTSQSSWFNVCTAACHSYVRSYNMKTVSRLSIVNNKSPRTA
ncbi:hypothetical protein Dimus_030152, partial [Dionaea muscipula]